MTGGGASNVLASFGAVGSRIALTMGARPGRVDGTATTGGVGAVAAPETEGMVSDWLISAPPPPEAM